MIWVKRYQMKVSVKPSDHPVVGHIQPCQNFKILRNGKRTGEMDEVEGGLGRFLAKADRDFEFLAKADRDRYLAVSFFGREFLAKADRDRYLAFLEENQAFFVSTPLTVEEGWNLYMYEFALHSFVHILSYHLQSLSVFVFVFLGSAFCVSMFVCLCVVVSMFVCLCVAVYLFVYLCVYMFVCLHVCSIL
jgi:hypothetical protein